LWLRFGLTVNSVLSSIPPWINIAMCDIGMIALRSAGLAMAPLDHGKTPPRRKPNNG
jgi:hypothetical protein